MIFLDIHPKICYTVSSAKTSEEVSTIKRISQYAKRIQSAWKAIPWKKIRLFAEHFWRRIAMPAVCVILCFALIATCFASIISSAVVDYTEDRIVTPEQLKELSIQFDYILILGCGVYDDGAPTPMLRDRVSVGVSLYQLGICDRILMSGDHEKDS